MDLTHAIRILEHHLGVPFTQGNRVRPLKNGVEIFPRMLGAIDRADREVLLLTFVYWTGKIARDLAEHLAEKARHGVRVRVLLDAFGARRMERELEDMMQDAGVELRWFRPMSRLKFWKTSHRTHRKILVCDGRIGFTGGVGIAAEWEGDARNPSEWRDTHFQLEGPCVSGLYAGFLSNWIVAGGEPAPDVQGFHQPFLEKGVPVQVINSVGMSEQPDSALLIRKAVDLAEKRLCVATAYFVPSDRIVGRLCDAARPGVRVDVLTPGPYIDFRIAQRAGEMNYGELLEGGVRIHRFQPTMLHEKLIIADAQLSVVGSPNINQRSFNKDDEICVTIADGQFSSHLESQFDADLKLSVPYTVEEWRKRPWTQRFSGRCTNLFRSEL